MCEAVCCGGVCEAMCRGGVGEAVGEAVGGVGVCKAGCVKQCGVAVCCGCVLGRGVVVGCVRWSV